MTKSACCSHGKYFLFIFLSYINFLQVFAMLFCCKTFSVAIWSTLETTMEIKVTRPFIVSFIPGDQYGGPEYFIIMYDTVLFY